MLFIFPKLVAPKTHLKFEGRLATTINSGNPQYKHSKTRTPTQVSNP
jgi:hypothetical protein